MLQINFIANTGVSYVVLKNDYIQFILLEGQAKELEFDVHIMMMIVTVASILP